MGSDASPEDLVTETFVYVFERVPLYDPEKGAWEPYIRTQIDSKLRHLVRAHRVNPTYIQEFWAKVANYERRLDRTATDRELQVYFNVSEDWLANIRRKTRSICRIDDLWTDMDDGKKPHSSLCTCRDDIIKEVIHRNAIDRLWECVDTLDTKYREILHRYYGEGQTIEEIAVALGYKSCSGVAQARNKALRQLKQLLENDQELLESV